MGGAKGVGGLIAASCYHALASPKEYVERLRVERTRAGLATDISTCDEGRRLLEIINRVASWRGGGSPVLLCEYLLAACDAGFIDAIEILADHSAALTPRWRLRVCASLLRSESKALRQHIGTDLGSSDSGRRALRAVRAVLKLAIDSEGQATADDETRSDMAKLLSTNVVGDAWLYFGCLVAAMREVADDRVTDADQCGSLLASLPLKSTRGSWSATRDLLSRAVGVELDAASSLAHLLVPPQPEMSASAVEGCGVGDREGDFGVDSVLSLEKGFAGQPQIVPVKLKGAPPFNKDLISHLVRSCLLDPPAASHTDEEVADILVALLAWLEEEPCRFYVCVWSRCLREVVKAFSHAVRMLKTTTTSSQSSSTAATTTTGSPTPSPSHSTPSPSQSHSATPSPSSMFRPMTPTNTATMTEANTNPSPTVPLPPPRTPTPCPTAMPQPAVQKHPNDLQQQQQQQTSPQLPQHQYQWQQQGHQQNQQQQQYYQQQLQQSQYQQHPQNHHHHHHQQHLQQQPQKPQSQPSQQQEPQPQPPPPQQQNQKRYIERQKAEQEKRRLMLMDCLVPAFLVAGRVPEIVAEMQRRIRRDRINKDDGLQGSGAQGGLWCDEEHQLAMMIRLLRLRFAQALRVDGLVAPSELTKDVITKKESNGEAQSGNNPLASPSASAAGSKETAVLGTAEQLEVSEGVTSPQLTARRPYGQLLWDELLLSSDRCGLLSKEVRRKIPSAERPEPFSSSRAKDTYENWVRSRPYQGWGFDCAKAARSLRCRAGEAYEDVLVRTDLFRHVPMHTSTETTGCGDKGWGWGALESPWLVPAYDVDWSLMTLLAAHPGSARATLRFAMKLTRIVFTYKKQASETVPDTVPLKLSRFASRHTEEELVVGGHVCGICKHVLSDPIQLEACGHRFCRRCIVSWSERGDEVGSRCPLSTSSPPQCSKGSLRVVSKCPDASFLHAHRHLVVTCVMCDERVVLHRLRTHEARCFDARRATETNQEASDSTPDGGPTQQQTADAAKEQKMEWLVVSKEGHFRYRMQQSMRDFWSRRGVGDAARVLGLGFEHVSTALFICDHYGGLSLPSSRKPVTMAPMANVDGGNKHSHNGGRQDRKLQLQLQRVAAKAHIQFNETMRDAHQLWLSYAMHPRSRARMRALCIADAASTRLRPSPSQSSMPPSCRVPTTVSPSNSISQQRFKTVDWFVALEDGTPPPSAPIADARRWHFLCKVMMCRSPAAASEEIGRCISTESHSPFDLLLALPPSLITAAESTEAGEAGSHNGAEAQRRKFWNVMVSNIYDSVPYTKFALHAWMVAKAWSSHGSGAARNICRSDRLPIPLVAYASYLSARSGLLSKTSGRDNGVGVGESSFWGRRHEAEAWLWRLLAADRRLGAAIGLQVGGPAGITAVVAPSTTRLRSTGPNKEHNSSATFAPPTTVGDGRSNKRAKLYSAATKVSSGRWDPNEEIGRVLTSYLFDNNPKIRIFSSVQYMLRLSASPEAIALLFSETVERAAGAATASAERMCFLGFLPLDITSLSCFLTSKLPLIVDRMFKCPAHIRRLAYMTLLMAVVSGCPSPTVDFARSLVDVLMVAERRRTLQPNCTRDVEPWPLFAALFLVDAVRVPAFNVARHRLAIATGAAALGLDVEAVALFSAVCRKNHAVIAQVLSCCRGANELLPRVDGMGEYGD